MPAATVLKRGIRFRDLALFYVVVALNVRWTSTAAAAGPSILIIWLAALSCFFVPLAASVMELSSRHPEEGGIYVWTREAFGDMTGFLAAWMYWMSNLPFFASVLYFGAARGEDKPFDAHAWLDAAGVEVTGYPVAHDFTEIACFD